MSYKEAILEAVKMAAEDTKKLYIIGKITKYEVKCRMEGILALAKIIAEDEVEMTVQVVKEWRNFTENIN